MWVEGFSSHRGRCAGVVIAGSWPLRSGGDYFFDAEMLFDCSDTDFKLEAFVDFVFLELGQLGVEAIDFRVELVDPANEARFDCGKIVLGRHVLDDMR